MSEQSYRTRGEISAANLRCRARFGRLQSDQNMKYFGDVAWGLRRDSIENRKGKYHNLTLKPEIRPNLSLYGITDCMRPIDLWTSGTNRSR